MSENLPKLSLDPWAASSLLQKAVRRGKAELASHAAMLLHRYRGEAIWRRLATIAVEDIGIAGLDLVAEVVRLATDKQLRSVLGSDRDLLKDLCCRLTDAAKDRSADLLYSAASLTLRSAARGDLFQLDPEPWTMPEDVADLVQYAAEALISCTSGPEETLKPGAVEEFIRSRGPFPAALEETVARLARIGAHPFCLMLLPLWTALSASNSEPGVETETLPKVEIEREIPLHVFDMHTALGKAAIARFARECPAVRKLLAQHVGPENRSRVALIAAFYADAAPVARRLVWQRADSLYLAGLKADMVAAGCPQHAALEIVECVTRHLTELNEFRRTVVTGRSRSKCK